MVASFHLSCSKLWLHAARAIKKELYFNRKYYNRRNDLRGTAFNFKFEHVVRASRFLKPMGMECMQSDINQPQQDGRHGAKASSLQLLSARWKAVQGA